MSIVLVTGGSGTLGRHLVPVLGARGHEVRVLSRRPGGGTHVGDLATGAGVAEAGAGAELVVHAASDPRMGRTDQRQTANLLDALPSCRHLVYVSIVGVDAIPFGYNKAKLACEELIGGSATPATVLRATQFHELLIRMLRGAARLPVAPIPLDALVQGVAAAEVAGRVADLLAGPALGRAPDFGGPEVLNGWQLVAILRARLGWPKSVLNVRLPGRVYRGFADGLNTCPDHADGRQTWAEFVRSQE
jgi:uncharacterized protein YbjT (DUF2867 family)